MGWIAKNLIASFREASKDLAEAAKLFSSGMAADDMPSPEELIAEGYDPQHVMYVCAQHFTSLFVDGICQLDELDEYSEIAARAQDEYMPYGPPMSPITQSFFWTWTLFDLQFGKDRETVGSCLLELMRSMDAPQDMLGPLEKFVNSRMGIYLHSGMRDNKVRLRELVTGEEFLCHSTSGYHGRKNELWYVRLMPPVSADFDYHIVMTTPYVLIESSAKDWIAYLNKHLLDTNHKRRLLDDLLKYGNKHVNWMEFVFQAYHHHKCDAIFLAGIPDVSDSLPPSTLHNEIETGATERPDAVLRVKLTEVQRRVIASMYPELAARLRLSEKNQRTIELRQSELQRVITAARTALPTTSGSRRIALKKIIAADKPARNPRTSTTAIVYQFKITLVGSDRPIWRRIEVKDCTLAEFHYAIQGAMGWMDSHLHEFNIKDQRYSAPPPLYAGPMDADITDATTVKLSELIGGQKKFHCQYLYDFGDSWEHVIELEDIIATKPKLRYPRCTDGERACPPEDCGGIWGFYEFVDAMADRKHPDHQDLKEWFGGPFKPNAFDKNKATREMRRWAD